MKQIGRILQEAEDLKRISQELHRQCEELREQTDVVLTLTALQLLDEESHGTE